MASGRHLNAGAMVLRRTFLRPHRFSDVASERRRRVQWRRARATSRRSCCRRRVNRRMPMMKLGGALRYHHQADARLANR